MGSMPGEAGLAADRNWVGAGFAVLLLAGAAALAGRSLRLRTAERR